MNLSENTKISEIIKIAVNKLNTILYNEKIGFQFIEIFEEYDIKPSRKNGDPKLDLPSLDKDASVGSTAMLNFSLIYRKEDLRGIKKKPKCLLCVIC